jgi:hypothetical protein
MKIPAHDETGIFVCALEYEIRQMGFEGISEARAIACLSGE